MAVKQLKKLIKMIHLKFSLAFFLLISTDVIVCQNISLGPEIGGNIINVESTPLGNNYQLGMHFGARVNYPFSAHFSLSSGVFLTQKKKRYSFMDTTTTFDAGGLLGGLLGGGVPDPDNVQAEIFTTTKGAVSQLYLEIPILIDYKFNHIHFYVGPSIGFLLSANRKETSESTSNATDVTSFLPGGLGDLIDLGQAASEPDVIETNTKDGLNSIDFGLVGGIGYNMDHLQFNLMYTYGFLDYENDTNNKELENHQTVRFSIAYLLNLKKESTTKIDRFL